MAQMQIGAIDTIRLARDAGPRVRTAAGELARWIERLGARKPTIGAEAGDVTALLSTSGTDLEPECFRRELCQKHFGLYYLLVIERLQQNSAEQKPAEPTYTGFLIEVS